MSRGRSLKEGDPTEAFSLFSKTGLGLGMARQVPGLSKSQRNITAGQGQPIGFQELMKDGWYHEVPLLLVLVVANLCQIIKQMERPSTSGWRVYP